MELSVVVFMLSWAEVYSEVYWIVANKPVIYEDNIILTCKTGHVLTDRVQCPVRKWHGGHKNKLLLYNKISRNVTKYEDRTNVSSTDFSLVIRNYTESDLNINYTCSCGIKLKSCTKLLGLNDENFIVPPLRVDTHIQQSNETLLIYLHIERVYPHPECSIVIGERTVFVKENLTSVKRDTFFSATCEASLNIVADDCGKKPTLLCYIGNEYNIVNISGDSMLNCIEVRGDGGNTTGYNSTSTEAYTEKHAIVALGVSLVVLIVCLTVLVFKFYARKHIQKRKRTDDIIDSDGDLRKKMLPVKSKIHK